MRERRNLSVDILSYSFAKGERFQTENRPQIAFVSFPSVQPKQRTVFSRDKKKSLFQTNSQSPGPGNYILPNLKIKRTVKIGPVGKEPEIKEGPGPGSFDDTSLNFKLRASSYSMGKQPRKSPFEPREQTIALKKEPAPAAPAPNPGSAKHKLWVPPRDEKKKLRLR